MTERKDYIIIYINNRDYINNGAFTRTLGQFLEDCMPTKEDIDYLMSTYDREVKFVKSIKTSAQANKFLLANKLTLIIKELVIGAILNLPEIVNVYKKVLSGANLKFKGYNIGDPPGTEVEYTLKDIMHFISEDYIDDLVSLAEYGKEQYNL